MKNLDFPLFKTKIDGVDKTFDLTSPEQRKEYFELKAGNEIERLREYLKHNTFVAYLLGKKNSGKGTYAKMLQEIVAPDRIQHFSIGDMIRSFDEIMQDKQKRQELEENLRKNYRGYLDLKQILKSMDERSIQVLLPSELILALLKMELSQEEKKALFIDGFPRSMDQVSYSLFFRDLIGYRDDPDVFVLIDVPEKVIDERIKYRRICPACQTSRNIKLLPTKQVVESKNGEFNLLCDNSVCENQEMGVKEGDEQGIEPIKERLRTDEELVKQAFSLYGIPKVVLRNSVPVAEAEKYVDNYELTPEFVHQKSASGAIETIEKPWQVEDDNGVMSYSLMPPPVVVSLIKQLVEVLGI